MLPVLPLQHTWKNHMEASLKGYTTPSVAVVVVGVVVKAVSRNATGDSTEFDSVNPTYEGWLISKVSYLVVSLVVGGKKRLRMRSVVDTV